MFAVDGVKYLTDWGTIAAVFAMIAFSLLRFIGMIVLMVFAYIGAMYVWGYSFPITSLIAIGVPAAAFLITALIVKVED